MLPLIVVLFVAVPVVELVVLFEVADAIGWMPALVLFVAVPILGLIVLRYEGFTSLQRLQETLRRGQPPTLAVLDVAFVAIGAILMIVPGFVTAFFGVALMIPPVRRLAARAAYRSMRKRSVWSYSNNTSVQVGRSRRYTGEPIQTTATVVSHEALQSASDEFFAPQGDDAEATESDGADGTSNESGSIDAGSPSVSTRDQLSALESEADSGLGPELDAAWGDFDTDRRWIDEPTRRFGTPKRASSSSSGDEASDEPAAEEGEMGSCSG